MTTICMNEWHNELDPESIHCESCGMRSDGQVTLANMTLGLFIRLRMEGEIILFHQHTDEQVSGLLEIRDGGFLVGDSRGDKIIPVREATDWLVYLD